MALLGGHAVVMAVSWELPSAQNVCPRPGVQVAYAGAAVAGSALGGGMVVGVMPGGMGLKGPQSGLYTLTSVAKSVPLVPSVNSAIRRLLFTTKAFRASGPLNPFQTNQSPALMP